MSDYPTKVWEAADGHTYKTEGEAIEASKTYFTREFMFELLDTRKKISRYSSPPNDELREGVRWFVANPKTILEAFEEAKGHAETKVVPS